MKTGFKMKGIIIYVVAAVLLVLGGTLECMAQKNMALTPYFSEKTASNPKVTAVTVSGKSVEKFGLSLYRSISVDGDAALASAIEKAVKADGAKAVSKEVSYKKGRLYFGLYTLSPAEGVNRYMVYLNDSSGSGGKVIVAYLEGKAGSSAVRRLLEGK